jgi:hypothetical protein
VEAEEGERGGGIDGGGVGAVVSILNGSCAALLVSQSENNAAYSH